MILKEYNQVPDLYSDLQDALDDAESWNATVPVTDSYTASEDITVPSGVTLKIYSDVTLSFASGKGLIANGELHIQGTSGSPVTLEPTGGSWAGVHLHGSGSSLRYAEIEDAVNGISIFNTSNISLEEVEVSGSSSNGIHIVNSTNLSISDIRSEDNFLRGINLEAFGKLERRSCTGWLHPVGLYKQHSRQWRPACHLCIHQYC